MRDVPQSQIVFYNRGGVCPGASFTTSPTTSSTSSKSNTSSKSSTSRTSGTSSTSSTPSTWPASIGDGKLICVPTSPERKGLGFKTDTVGSIGYTGSSPADYVGFYTRGALGNQNSYCKVAGILYHQQSGLCVTAIATASAPAYSKYLGATVQLQPCDLSSPLFGAQAFCGVRGASSFNILFLGDNYLGTLYGFNRGIDTPVILGLGGAVWGFDC